jgi:hypothetical protein
VWETSHGATNLLIARIARDARGFGTLESVGTVACVSDGTDLIASDEALLCPHSGGIAVNSLSDPVHPRFVRTIRSAQSSGHQSHGTFVFDNGCLFQLFPGRFSVFDAANPLSPRYLATLPFQPFLYGGCVVDGRMYVASSKIIGGKGRGGISVYDVSRPREPQALGFVETGDELSYQLLPVDAKRLVATTTQTIALYGLDDPLKPTLIGSPLKLAKPSGRTAAMFTAAGRSFAIVNGAVYSVEQRELKKYGDFTWGGNADGFPYRAAVQGDCIAIPSGAFVTVLFANLKD